MKYVDNSIDNDVKCILILLQYAAFLIVVFVVELSTGAAGFVYKAKVTIEIFYIFMRYYSSSDTMEVTKTKTIFQSAILKLGSFFKEEKGHH